MRLALFSDVHGNFTALESVLIDIERRDVDLVVFVGDLCLMGPRPAACLRLVHERRLAAVIGNTDEFVLGRAAPPERLNAIAEWTSNQLTPEDREALGRLPFSLRISPTGRAGDDLLVVHANPTDLNGIIFPAEDAQLERYGRVRQSDDELAPLMSGYDGAALAYGHLHLPGRRVWHNKLLVNISSVNMPGDADPRAKYAIMSWENGHWAAEHHYVLYPVQPEIDAFRANRPPHWEEAVSELETQGYYYPQRI